MPPVMFEGYAFESSAIVPGRPADVADWLLEPARLVRWMIGIDRVEPVTGDPRVVGARITAQMVHRGIWTTPFVGELTELSADRITRCYRPEIAPGTGRSTVAVRLGALSGSSYVRTVRYRLAIDLEGTAMTTAVEVAIPGIGNGAARLAARAEQRSLQRSLRRLRLVAGGGRPGLPARFRDAAHTPQLL